MTAISNLDGVICKLAPLPSRLQDIWVCNAGQSQQVKRPLAEAAAGELQSIVDTNLMGELILGLQQLLSSACSDVS